MIIYEMVVDKRPQRCMDCPLFINLEKLPYAKRAHECSKVVHEDFGVAIAYHAPDERCLLKVKK